MLYVFLIIGEVIENDEQCDYGDYTNTCEEFLAALVDLLVSLPVDESTLPLHVESIRSLLLLMSVQLHKESACCTQLSIVQYLMRGTVAQQAVALCQRLVDNYTCAQLDKLTLSPTADGGSIVVGLANSLMSTLSWMTGEESSSDEASSNITHHPCASSDASLSNLSLLLLVCLCCHSATPTNANTDDSFDDDDEEKSKKNEKNDDANKYRHAMATFGNAQGKC